MDKAPIVVHVSTHEIQHSILNKMVLCSDSCFIVLSLFALKYIMFKPLCDLITVPFESQMNLKFALKGGETLDSDKRTAVCFAAFGD